MVTTLASAAFATGAKLSGPIFTSGEPFAPGGTSFAGSGGAGARGAALVRGVAPGGIAAPSPLGCSFATLLRQPSVKSSGTTTRRGVRDCIGSCDSLLLRRLLRALHEAHPKVEEHLRKETLLVSRQVALGLL